MAKIDENSIAKLKALFQDNEKALGSNFSQLIDFFNDNKVTDNGDGTYSVGDITLDASKLYNLIISGVTQQQLATKADDSTVVHTADMRKPANDVAGIEEVNAKQDKIGYTPADDSKVVHTADASIWQKYPITDVSGSLTTYIGTTYSNKPVNESIKQLLDTSINGFYTLYVDKDTPDTPDSLDNLRGIIQLQNNHIWGVLTGELTKVSYYVGGTYYGNTNDLNWTQIAEDSKVAHLSGANNFDTVPTVNNNPLLLASSLPSDLARTGQANTFSKQQIFSTNPTNGTQVYPIYATVDTDADATTLIASLQSSGFSGMVGVPES